jgi:hypothetical protein
MSKMGIPFKVQKPGENRGKKCNAESFIQEATEATDKRKQILAAIKSILHKHGGIPTRSKGTR